jgi:hypothetical protein
LSIHRGLAAISWSAFAVEAGYTPITICSPLEVIGDDDDNEEEV